MENNGRRKTEMKLVEEETARQVTFSKRRSGLFKKASELCTMCAAQVAVIIFSIAGGKAYSFGHPNVHSVFDMLNHSDNADASTSQNVDGQDPSLQDYLIKTYYDLLERVEIENQRGKKKRKTAANHPESSNWLDAPLGRFNLEELYKMKGGLEEVKKKVHKDKEELLALLSPSSDEDSTELSHLPETDESSGDTCSFDHSD